MRERDEVRETLFEVLGPEGCGIVCEDAEILEDEQGFSLRLCGFLEPWRLGATVGEAGAALRRLSGMGFGLGGTRG